MSSSWDYTELAARMMGMTEKEYEALEEESDEYDKIDEMLSEKYDVLLDAFMNVARALLPMTNPQYAVMSGELKHVMGVFDDVGFRSIVDVKCTMFRIGSIVRLSRSSPDMRIITIADKEALCEWYVDEKVKSELIPVANLILTAV